MRYLYLALALSLACGLSIAQDIPSRPRIDIPDRPAVKYSLTTDWPDLPRGFKTYRKARYSQYLSITNGADHIAFYRHDQDDTLFGRANPNRLFPIAVPGGLHNATGWESKTAVSIPEGKKVLVWTQRVEAGARRLLPRLAWWWPDKTVFAEVLYHDGKPFEVRTMTKTNGKWIPARPFVDKDNQPKGYARVQNCNDCHSRAGEQPGYGLSWKGWDNIFSAVPHKDGSLELDTENWPIEVWQGETERREPTAFANPASAFSFRGRTC